MTGTPTGGGHAKSEGLCGPLISHLYERRDAIYRVAFRLDAQFLRCYIFVPKIEKANSYLWVVLIFMLRGLRSPN